MTERTASGLVRYRDLVMDNARWDAFTFRPGDIVISTPAKAGTTWMQMICVLLILQTPELPRPLGEISPWLEMPTRSIDDVVAELDAQPHRRVIKSHTPFDGLPFHDDVYYVCVGRDPRDAAFSFFNHRANMDFGALLAARAAAVGTDDLDELLGEDEAADRAEAEARSPAEQFEEWVGTDDPERAGVVDVMTHWRSFWAKRELPNVLLVHYGDLKQDLAGEMRRIAGWLGITVPEELWPDLVAAATFESMRSKADQLAPESRHRLWRDPRRFFDSGKNGKWRDVLTQDMLDRYAERVRELGDPELVAWLHPDGLLPG
jgi:aryl sulfotransferase